MSMEKEYWEKYYSSRPDLGSESNFAQYCWSKLRPQVVIDIGCGNFRDSLFFLGRGARVASVDQVRGTSIEHILTENIHFLEHQFGSHSNYDLKASLRDFLQPGILVYARFFYTLSQRLKTSIS